ncbi:CRISPR-associated protein Csn1 [Falsiroseomonas bella]|uniref:Superoxide dismutase [Cu-Zn] n=2 Tax=Falsiroseomonas bella TaxID=2184016 RepID=A0A317FEU6_9PROT|nr:CRISPR-associated protein Csn1 [Falsiroseomonas bella]
MRKAFGLAFLLSLPLAAGTQAQAGLQPQLPEGTPQAQGSFIDPKGERIGSAHLADTPNGVLITVELRNLPPGVHAFHVHETGRCEADGGFRSAGGHYAPRGHQHGYLVQGGAHAGDMPNQQVGEDGMLRAQVMNDKVTLRPGEASLLDRDGSAIVLHAQADDHRSQPAGDAGGRIACAVIERRG